MADPKDLDKTRDFTLGAGRTVTAKPGEDLFYNKATKRYEMRDVYKRPDYQKQADETPLFDPSKMKQDPDVPEPASAELKKRTSPPPKPPKKFAKGGVTRADGCAKKGHTKGRMR